MNKNLLSMTPKSPMQKAAKLVELEALKKQITEEIAEYKADLLKVTQELDVLSLKTGAYTITRAKRITPQVEDFKTLKHSLEKAEIPVLTEETFSPQMSIVFKNLIDKGIEMEGLSSLETEYIMVRLARKEESE